MKKKVKIHEIAVTFHECKKNICIFLIKKISFYFH